MSGPSLILVAPYGGQVIVPFSIIFVTNDDGTVGNVSITTLPTIGESQIPARFELIRKRESVSTSTAIMAAENVDSKVNGLSTKVDDAVSKADQALEIASATSDSLKTRFISR